MLEKQTLRDLYAGLAMFAEVLTAGQNPEAAKALNQSAREGFGDSRLAIPEQIAYNAWLISEAMIRARDPQ